MSSIAQVTISTPFIRKTYLEPNEYQANFSQIDNDVLDALTSPEARKVTGLMSHIYLCLKRAPAEFLARPGELHFIGIERDGAAVTAWERLCELCDVAGATLSKALGWMREKGIIGYHAHANGYGIRIWLNRAARSVRQRATAQKNLRLVPTSSCVSPTSRNEVAFKEHDSESVSEHENPHAPGGAAAETPILEIADRQPPTAEIRRRIPDPEQSPRPPAPEVATAQIAALIERSMGEHDKRLHEWLERYGLPKVARVVQAQCFRLLRSEGLLKPSNGAKVGAAAPEPQSADPVDYEEGARALAELATFLHQPLVEIIRGYLERGEWSREHAAELWRAAVRIGVAGGEGVA